MMTFHDVLGFWFSSATRPKWFEQSDAFDAEVRRLLMPVHEQAAAGRLPEWRETPEDAWHWSSSWIKCRATSFEAHPEPLPMIRLPAISPDWR